MVRGPGAAAGSGHPSTRPPNSFSHCRYKHTMIGCTARPSLPFPVSYWPILLFITHPQGLTNESEAPIATPLLLPAAASRASLGSCCRSCDWSIYVSLKRPRPIGKGHSRGLLANPSARFPFPISREPLSITLCLAPIGCRGGAAPSLFPPRRCGRWRS